MAELKPLQKAFCDEYIKSGNATQSYMKVYKCEYASADASARKLLENTRVKEYIKDFNKQLEPSKIADITEIKEYWTNIVRKDPMGVNGGLKASELIAKTAGAFIDRVEANNTNNNTTVSVSAKVDLSKLTDEELNNLEKLISKTSNE